MTRTGFLRGQVEFIVRIGGETVRHPFADGDVPFLQSGHFVRIVGHQPYIADPELAENFSGRAVQPLIGVETQLLIGIDRVEAFVLKGVGPQLIDQANATAFLSQIEYQATTLGADLGDRTAQLIAAIAPQTTEQIPGETLGVQSNQNGFVGVGAADEQSEMLSPTVARSERDDFDIVTDVQGHPGRADPIQGAGFDFLIIADVVNLDHQQGFVLSPGRQIREAFDRDRCHHRGG